MDVLHSNRFRRNHLLASLGLVFMLARSTSAAPFILTAQAPVDSAGAPLNLTVALTDATGTIPIAAGTTTITGTVSGDRTDGVWTISSINLVPADLVANLTISPFPPIPLTVSMAALTLPLNPAVASLRGVENAAGTILFFDPAQNPQSEEFQVQLAFLLDTGFSPQAPIENLLGVPLVLHAPLGFNIAESMGVTTLTTVFMIPPKLIHPPNLPPVLISGSIPLRLVPEPEHGELRGAALVALVCLFRWRRRRPANRCCLGVSTIKWRRA